MYLQSNPAISNSVNSKSPLFRRKIEFPWIFPSPLSFPGYFETPLFRTFVHFPWDFEIAGFDCILFLKHFKVVTSLKSGDNFSPEIGPQVAEGVLAICYRVVPGSGEIRLSQVILGSMLNKNVTDIGGT